MARFPHGGGHQLKRKTHTTFPICSLATIGRIRPCRQTNSLQILILIGRQNRAALPLFRCTDQIVDSINVASLFVIHFGS